MGYPEEAKLYITAALDSAISSSNKFVTVHALLFLAQVIAVQGDPVRALEIGAAARAASLWEKSNFNRKVLVEPLTELTAGVAPELASMIRQRGQVQDIFDIAAQLREEVQSPDWRWG